MLADLKYALRQLIKSPGFTVIATLTLALGIGLNTSMFSLMNLLILQPLPYPDKGHLVRIYRTTPQSQTEDHTASDYLDLARESSKFADVAAYRLWALNLAQADRPPVNLNALRVSGNFFPAIDLQPELGRWFNADEDRPGTHVIILSHATWQAQFGGDPTVIGRAVRIDGQPTTIVGVMPAAFSSIFLWGPGDAFRPFALSNEEKLDRNDASLHLLARVHSDLSLAQLNARLGSLAEELARNRPREHSQDGLRAVPLQSTVRNPGTVGISWLLLGLAGFVLLIACGNLANLQLARAIARAHEFAIRAALGASRARLLRPLLCESVLLALAGGGLGVLIAVWSNDWLSSRLSANGVVTFTVALDWRVLGFALGLSAVTGLVFGLVPAWVMSRVRVNEALKAGGRGQTGDRSQHRFRHGLIVAQFALALVLLAGAGVFLRGVDRMLATETGWDHHSLLQGVINLPQAKYTSPAQTYQFYRQLQERLAALPGVENVTIGYTLPVFQFLTSRSYVVEGRAPPAAGREPLANVNGVTPSFLSTLKIKLVAGRDFTDTDNLAARPVAIINESMARALFPNESPIGHRLGTLDPANRNWTEIVGVMPDVRFAISFTTPATQFIVFRPLAQETWNYATVALRARAADTLAEPMRRTIAEMDPDLPLQQLSTVDQLIKLGSSGLHLVDTLLIAFALLGLFLAALGLYGVIARLVVQRTPEIGVRVALGAQSRDVVWLVLRSGLRLTLLGTVLGLLGSGALVRIIAGIAPSISVQDPIAIIVVTLLLFAVALLACWLPARRAAKLDPMIALRAE